MEGSGSHSHTMALMGDISGPQFPILYQRKCHHCPPVKGQKNCKHSFFCCCIDFQISCLDGTSHRHVSLFVSAGPDVLGTMMGKEKLFRTKGASLDSRAALLSTCCVAPRMPLGFLIYQIIIYQNIYQKVLLSRGSPV